MAEYQFDATKLPEFVRDMDVARLDDLKMSPWELVMVDVIETALRIAKKQRIRTSRRIAILATGYLSASMVKLKEMMAENIIDFED